MWASKMPYSNLFLVLLMILQVRVMPCSMKIPLNLVGSEMTFHVRKSDQQRGVDIKTLMMKGL